MKTPIEIAKEFVALHKKDNVQYWEPWGEDDNEKWELIYDNLMLDVYGTVTTNAEYDAGGDIMQHPTRFKVKISSRDSKDGTEKLFEWEEEPPPVRRI